MAEGALQKLDRIERSEADDMTTLGGGDEDQRIECLKPNHDAGEVERWPLRVPFRINPRAQRLVDDRVPGAVYLLWSVTLYFSRVGVYL